MKSLMLSAVLALFMQAMTASATESQEDPEYEIKAAFLFNFARFVRWPDDASSDGKRLDLCLLGQDSFGASLDALRGRRLGTRTVGVRRPLDLEGISSCYIVFVAKSEQSRFTEILAAIGRHPILTVSEAEGFNESGGVINFVIRDNRIRFTINAEAAEVAGLELSSKLLRLALPLDDAAP